MADTSELIILVPGMSAVEPETNLEQLVTGFRRNGGVTVHSQRPGSGRRDIEVALPGNRSRCIHIREAYWSDLRPALSTKKTFWKIIEGFYLFVYWTTSPKVWKTARHSKFMLFNLLFFTLLLLAWYYGAFAAGLAALASDPVFFGQSLGLSEAWLADLKTIADKLEGWKVWSIAAVIMGILPATEAIDISHATRAYLLNQNGMQQKICLRITNALDEMLSLGKDYDRVTILSHSFGVVSAIEALADRKQEQEQKFRFVSMGGPLLLVGARSQRVTEAVTRFLSRDDLVEWLDFYSDHDWLCTKSPVSEAEWPKFKPQEASSIPTPKQAWNGESHGLYFEDQAVIDALVE